MRLVMLLIFALIIGICRLDAAVSTPDSVTSPHSGTDITDAQPVEKLPIVGFGDEAAPVKVVMYHSLTCHHCSDFKLNNFPDFKRRYVDTGQVYFELKDFPTDEFSLKLAIICWAGRDVNKYLERSQLIIENFNPEKNKKVEFDWANADKTTEVIEKLLTPTGITPEMIQTLFDDRALEDAILQEALTAGRELNLNFAPGFTINGKLVEMKDLEDAVEKAVQESQSRKK